MAYAETDPNGQLQVAAFRQHLQKLGRIEGSNVRIDLRYAADPAQVRALVVQLLGLGPDLMVANSNFVTATMQSEVHGTPLVFVSVSDPIGSGFVKDLARPSGNITGFANFEPSMGGKWLEKLLEIAPRVKRVGLMLHPEPPNFGYLKSAEAAAPALKIELTGLEVKSGNDIERAFAAFAGISNSAMIVVPNVVAFANSNLIVALAAPAIGCPRSIRSPITPRRAD
jgi:putative ABC transport system substrate-binding protein